MSQVLDFRNVEESIRATSSIGRLVPFIGAGASARLCRGWQGFLEALNQKLGLSTRELGKKPSSDELYRVADRAAFALRLLPYSERRKVIAEALVEEHNGTAGRIPPQATALAGGFWPLVVTTNYEDVYLAALGDSRSPRVLGRGKEHCDAVVRSFDVDQAPILWCVQGFTGRVVSQTDLRAIAFADVDKLTEEIVIGHQQYQTAANRNPDFRRSFGELYRRRSLIFIGSAVSESYFINLVSEIVLNYGPGVHQHYALFCDKELGSSTASGYSPVDVEFLEVRLGILPVRYGADYEALPSALNRICSMVGANVRSSAEKSRPQVVLPKSLSFDTPRTVEGSSDERATEISLRFSDLPKPMVDECVILSVGFQKIDKTIAPIPGRMAKCFLKLKYGLSLDGPVASRTHRWEAAEAEPRLFRLFVNHIPYPVFALAARDDSQKNVDQKNLIDIEKATCSSLTLIERSGEFSSVHMGVLAVGDRSFAYPTFPFLAQVRGIRLFARYRPAPADAVLRLVEIRIVDRSIIGPIVAGRLPVQEALTSDLVRVLVRIADASGSWESYAVAVGAHQTVEEVLSRYELPIKRMRVRASPLPYPGFTDVLQAPVFPMMLIHAEPQSPSAAPVPV